MSPVFRAILRVNKLLFTVAVSWPATYTIFHILHLKCGPTCGTDGSWLRCGDLMQTGCHRKTATFACLDRLGELDYLLKEKTKPHKKQKNKRQLCRDGKRREKPPTDHSQQHVIQEQSDENDEEDEFPRLSLLSEPF